MKKLVFAISFIFYFVATSGIVVNYHYCMKKLASVNLFSTGTDECGICGMETHYSNGCCHDDVQVVKLTQDQNKAFYTYYEIKAPVAAFQIPSTFIVADIISATNKVDTEYYPPPLLSAQDTYLQNNVFRI